MRPFLEALPWTDGSSLAVLDRRLDDAIPFQWHHHPEFELTLTRNSRGQRFIGDHVAEYGEYDLVLVGPNLPHTWVSDGKVDEAAPHWAQVIWFDPEWARALSATLVEYGAVGDVVTRGQRGLSFGADVGAAVAPAFEAFFQAEPRARVIGLLEILCRLHGAEAHVLASVAARAEDQGRQRRIDRVLAHLHREYGRAVRLEELADIAALSVSGLHRMFRRQTGQTVSGYVMSLRIGAASAQLAGSDVPVAHVAHDVGYGALANFNRQFKASRGMTPREYRAQFRDVKRGGSGR